MRDYNEVVRRIEAFQGPDVAVRNLGQVNGFPVLCASVGRAQDAPVFYVNGGTHGDEPAGVEAALSFIGVARERCADAARFEIVPCLNPWGYENEARENAQGVDINWAFMREDVPEVGMVKRLIEGRRFASVLDLHEDWESPGYYVYELFRNRPPVGQMIVEQVARICPLNMNSVIENAQAVNGVIHPNLEAETRRKGEGIPVALFQEYTDHLLTPETPTELPLNVRVAAQLATLEVVLDAHLSG